MGVHSGSSYRRLFRLIWPFIAILVLLTLLAVLSMNLMSAVRAYVGGESLWSKGQKDAIYALGNYLQTGQNEDYVRYQTAIAIPLSDHAARLALNLPQPDLEAARAGLIGGGNRQADIPVMIWMYRNFQQVSYLKRAISIWAEADQHIERLNQLAAQIHDGFTHRAIDENTYMRFHTQIRTINDRLTPLETAFSATLSEASWVIHDALLYVNIGAAILLISFATRRTYKLLSESAALERALQTSEERLQLALSGSRYGIWDWDIPAERTYISPQYKKLFGLPENDQPIRYIDWVDRLHPDDHAVTLATLTAHLEDNQPYDIEYRFGLPGAYRWIHVIGKASRDAQGRPYRMSGTFDDITERKRIEAALRAEQERASVTLAAIGDAVLTTDTTGQISYMNTAAESLFGCTNELACGESFSTLCRIIDEENRQTPIDPATQILAGETPDTEGRNLLLICPDGGEIAVQLVAAAVHDEAGKVAGVVLALHDMTRERQYVANLSWQASHDELTGLANRREFELRLSRLLEDMKRRPTHNAVLFIDMDQFKIVNDTSGHSAGDELLRQVSNALIQNLREGDTLARLGGDEFGVILAGCRPDPAERIAEALRAAIENLHFAWGNQPFPISISVGLVNFESPLTTLEDILRSADAACYLAKEKGRNRVQHYRPDDAELTIRHGEMEWVHRLRLALDEDRFCLYSQPIVPVRNHETGAHFELLLRLRDEHGEVVPPIAFIPAAERFGLMPQIDRWVVRTALSTIAERYPDGQGADKLVCAINLSGSSLGDDTFLDFIHEQFTHSGVAPDSICFEITETSAIANLKRATHFMHELHQLGCRFSLDDFGAGMSSFAYLKHLPVDYLKIDGGFVKNLATDPTDRAMVVAINHIGHVMGKRTIAEFAENDAIIQQLQEIGVDYIQGYGIARPAPFTTSIRSSTQSIPTI
ncbi:EAL domain-containing protein [Andreprevotia chitinilytica]|uniref:EAL domain-containing protein n=1 Tax=Andreprevotia chitinilytica TaxID=396808 RepID=UPI000689E0B7|nr:EAL domain-containing protein [Andreprevotia chitinilytica]